MLRARSFSEPLASAPSAKAEGASFAVPWQDPATASDVWRREQRREPPRPQASEVVSRSCAPSQITNTLAGYRTAELSDSPRASVMPPVPAFDRAAKTRPPAVRFRGAGSAVGRASSSRRDVDDRRALQIPPRPWSAPRSRAWKPDAARAAVRRPSSARRVPSRYRVVMRDRRAPPSAHLDVSGRAPAVKPQGLDCRRHAAADDSPVCGWGLHTPPPQVELYQPSRNLPYADLRIAVSTEARTITGASRPAPCAAVVILVLPSVLAQSRVRRVRGACLPGHRASVHLLEVRAAVMSEPGIGSPAGASPCKRR